MLALLRAALSRALGLLLVLAGAVVLVHMLLALSPGDAVDLVAAPEQRAALEQAWGLDRPLPVRILQSLLSVARGELGLSLVVRPGAPVADLALAAWLRSLGLLLSSLALGLVLSMGLSLLSLRWGRSTSGIELGVRILSAGPVFLLAFLLVSGINALTWELLQAGLIGRPGWFALPERPSLLRSALAVSILAIGSGSLSELHREVEDALRAALASPWAEAVRARGEPLWPHLVTNLVAPLAASLSSRAVLLAGGLVILEKVLLLNGAGTLLWEAALRRDLPLAAGLTLASALVLGLLRLLFDMLALWADPRLRGNPA